MEVVPDNVTTRFGLGAVKKSSRAVSFLLAVGENVFLLRASLLDEEVPLLISMGVVKQLGSVIDVAPKERPRTSACCVPCVRGPVRFAMLGQILTTAINKPIHTGQEKTQSDHPPAAAALTPHDTLGVKYRQRESTLLHIPGRYPHRFALEMPPLHLFGICVVLVGKSLDFDGANSELAQLRCSRARAGRRQTWPTMPGKHRTRWSHHA